MVIASRETSCSTWFQNSTRSNRVIARSWFSTIPGSTDITTASQRVMDLIGFSIPRISVPDNALSVSSLSLMRGR